MKHVKKYIIEFFVIVLGVSVSFLAEQWRQDLNTRQERNELIDKAKDELKLWLAYDSMNERGSSEAWLRKFVFEKSAIDADTFMVQLGEFVNNGDITHRWPNLVLVAQRKDLDPERNEVFRGIYELLEAIKENDDGAKKTIDGELLKLFNKYNLDYDMLTYGLANEKEISKGALDYNTFSIFKKMDKRGDYKGFFQDAEVQRVLRHYYSYLLTNRIQIAALKILYRDLIRLSR